jgi:hypothetical protein
MEFSSMDLEGGSEAGSYEAGDASKYKVPAKGYGERLTTFIESLHQRYEITFAPVKRGKQPHHLEVVLTKSGKGREPSALLRYRSLYSDDAPEEATDSKRQMDWQKLDSAMRSALDARENVSVLAFEVQRTAASTNEARVFVLKIQPDQLTWRMLPSGGRRSQVTMAVASYSGSNRPMGLNVKEFEVVQAAENLEELRNQTVEFSMPAALAKKSSRVRLVLRDVATGRIGTKDMPLS